MNATRREQLESLHRGIQRCRKCRLGATRTHAVPGEGPHDAALMLIGEAPGENEDATGRPFCGRSGRFLDELLEFAGIARGSVYITASVKCRPPANRLPRADELRICRAAWLDRQIEMVDPALIVALGGCALRQLCDQTAPLAEVHGRVFDRAQRRVLITYHPAAGMRFPHIRRSMREDFKTLHGLLHRIG